MSIFKCKMCGGDLEIAEGVTIAECEYCGTKQTVPKAMDENLQNLFNRANTLRIKSEFDKAEKLYEKIIQADTTQSEAYWGLILCKYGIEYVDDPATFKKIPTCHRASYDSIIADDDYKFALENADMNQRAIYEEQAREIDRIQKDILALAQKEETYDVFICYKETDADGKRTQDSVIANDIYYQLTQEGFKVFYAAITLEGKLGSAYEPIIFAALNSAKVMLSIGTKPEYFNAVWVKNEWSRFLKIIKKDRSKLLIPCYRDMDAYELPEEFAHLQAQDMSKIGFINDIVRGITKVIKKDEPKTTTVVKEALVHNESTTINIAPLLERAFMFLEDEDWNSADEYCEKVLDQDPKNAQAYLGKLMAELKVNKQDELRNCSKPFDNRNNYQKAIRFGDSLLKNMLSEVTNYINTRNENARIEKIYADACACMVEDNIGGLLQASKLFDSIKDFKDSAILSDACLNRIYEPAVKMVNTAQTREDCLSAIGRLEHIKNYKDSSDLIVQCNERILELLYNKAVDLMRCSKSGYDFSVAIATFMEIPGYSDYRDVSDMIEACRSEIENIKVEAAKAETYNKALNLHNLSSITHQKEAIAIFKSLEGWRDSDQKIEACYAKIDKINELYKHSQIEKERKKKKAITVTIIIAVIIAMIIAAILVVTKIVIPNNNYNKAIDLMEQGKYSEAVSALEMLEGYKDSADKIYLSALELMDAEKYTEAMSAFMSLDGYKDSISKIEECNINIYGEEVWNKIKTVNVGDIYSFGSYEQDNNKANGQEDVEWLVLAKEGTKILVISKYALDCQPYNTSYTVVTWETCTLRKWLNNDFLGAAFSADEKAMIPTVTVSADKNPDYSTNPGNATQDQVFLLSITEANKYFSSDSARLCEPTDYAVANGVYVDSSIGNCWWWLRTPGDYQNDAARVDLVGVVGAFGYCVDYDTYAVRPAMWIDLSKIQ